MACLTAETTGFDIDFTIFLKPRPNHHCQNSHSLLVFKFLHLKCIVIHIRYIMIKMTAKIQQTNNKPSPQLDDTKNQ